MDSFGSFEKLKKTSAFIDESIHGSFLRLYGIDGINFANMEEVYNPLVSGLGSMHKVRQHLLSRGMTAQFTDILAAKYIKKVEENDSIFTIMDFFSTNRDSFKAMDTLSKAAMYNVRLNYTTLPNFSEHVNKADHYKALNSLNKNSNLDLQYVASSRL